MNKIVSLIPALNEGPRIYTIVRELLRHSEIVEVIVVNNGSTDNTAAEAIRAGATVVTEPLRGYGAACLAGLAKVPDDTYAVLFINADGAEKIAEASLLTEPLSSYDLVIGSRTLGQADRKALLPQQIFGNWLACQLIYLFWGQRFSDLGPFRLIKWTQLKQLNMQDKGYGWIIEMQLKAIKHQLRILEVPVTTRCSTEPSKIAGTFKGVVGAGWKILTTILMHALFDKKTALNYRKIDHCINNSRKEQNI